MPKSKKRALKKGAVKAVREARQQKGVTAKQGALPSNLNMKGTGTSQRPKLFPGRTGGR